MPFDFNPVIFLPLFFIFAFSSLGWGLLMLRMSGGRRLMPDCLHTLFYAGILGVLIEGNLFLAAGALGLLQPILLISIICLGIAAFALSAKMLFPLVGEQTNRRGVVSFWVLSLPFIFLIFIYAMFPDDSGDAYLYHLTVPNYYAQEGHIGSVPISFCFNYPLLIEMFYMAAIRLSHEQAGVMMNAALALLACLGLFLTGRKTGGALAGYASAFIFISTPLTLIWAPTSLVDCSTAAFLAGALLALLRWRGGADKRWLYLAGVCAGGAMAVKLLMGFAALAVFPLGVLGVSVFGMRSVRPRNTASNLLLYSAGAATAYAPWIIKNALLTGNPVFPFFVKFIPTRPDLARTALLLHEMHGLPAWKGMGELLERMAGLLPLMAWDATWMPVIAMAIIPFGWVCAVRKKSERFFWSVLILLEGFLIFYGRVAQVRWFQGFYALFALAPALILARYIKENPRLGRNILVIGVAFIYILAGRIYYLRIYESGQYPWLIFSHSALVKYMQPAPKLQDALLLNEVIPPDGRALLYDKEILSAGRWMRRRFIQAGKFQFDYWAEEGLGVEEIYRRLKEMGATHIVALEDSSHKSFDELIARFCRQSPSSLHCKIYALN
ncbi:MAG TPA: glycosyltransferase family 39 protein [Candidatus Sumerlaeota bacterium]|nr:glycosyltransferase family 39 protein [Candidatus Sumerlaeota bacterium]